MTLATDINLVDLVVNNLGQPQKRGRQPFWLCPFHDDHNPSLTLTPDRRHWKCFGCGRSGDAIDWLQQREGLSFAEAAARLDMPASHYAKSSGELSIEQYKRESSPPDAKWQDKAETVVSACADELGRGMGAKACRWLAERGLEPETLSRWRLGYNNATGNCHGLWLDRGILIPWLRLGKVETINVRRPEGHPKYKLVAGSRRRGLFLAEAFRPGFPALLVEGELDALLGWQELRDLVNVGTLGSATSRPNSNAIRSLLGSPVILVAYDRDECGTKGAQAWRALSSRVRTIDIPFGKDLTDFFLRGGDVRDWIKTQLHLNRPSATRHPTVGVNQRHDNEILVGYGTRHYPTVQDTQDGIRLSIDNKEEVAC